MSYATVADVRSRYDTDADDASVQDGLDFAEALIDARSGMKFGTEPKDSYTTYDVRTDTVLLPLAYSSLVSVTVDEQEIDSLRYEEIPFGIRFKDMPILRPNFRGPTITIEGEFIGEEVPLLIKQASVLLAIDYLKSLEVDSDSSDGSILPELPDDVKNFSVEGLQISRFDKETVGPTRISTGNTTANRLVDLAVHAAGGTGGIA